MYVLVYLLASFVSVNAWFFRSSPDWDGLKVHWGANPFSSSNYISQPRTESAARAAGFEMISDCGDTPHFVGKRYVKNGDTSIVLIFDSQGYIAGMQAGVPSPQANGYPKAPLQNAPFVLYENVNYVTAYFVDPQIICTTGRSRSRFNREGTGSDLYIQNGTTPAASNLLHIPKEMSGLASTKWTRGGCFPTMGRHYWYNVKLDMSCDNLFPVFLMYNSGKLNAFGWAFVTDLSSSHYEHPPTSAYSTFIKPVPTCLERNGVLSTMHIYLDDTPVFNFC